MSLYLKTVVTSSSTMWKSRLVLSSACLYHTRVRHATAERTRDVHSKSKTLTDVQDATTIANHCERASPQKSPHSAVERAIPSASCFVSVRICACKCIRSTPTEIASTGENDFDLNLEDGSAKAPRAGQSGDGDL